MMNETVAQVCGLHLTLGGKKILENVSLSVPRHSRFALLGRNGTGKTTLLRAINNLVPFDAGEVFLLGYRIPDQHALVKPSVAYLFDRPVLYDHLSPLEIFEYTAALWGMEPAVARTRADYYLRKFALWDDRNAWTEQFSKGMRQKVAVIAVLMRAPSLLILDEPFDGLDAAAVDTLLVLLHEYSLSGTVLFTSHNPVLVQQLANHAAVLEGGRIRVEGAFDADMLKADLVDDTEVIRTE